MRNSALHRQWQMLHVLYNYRIRGISKRELSDEFDVSTKTIERDIANLSSSGFPIYEETIKNDYNKVKYFMTRDYLIPELRFSLLENYIMYVLMKVTSPVKGFFEDALENSHKKLFSQAPVEFRNFARKFSKLILPDSTNRVTLSDSDKYAFAKILEAILGNKQIAIQYKSIYSNKLMEHILSPLCIKFYRNNFYMAAYLKRKQQVLVFALNRITELNVLNSRQDGVKFNPQEFFEQEFGITRGKKFITKLRFEKEIVQFASERIWHKNQITTFNDDGTMTIEIPSKSIQEMISLVLSFQDKVEILEPRELREEMKVILKRISSKYE